MEIRLKNVAKHFGREVVFKDLSTTLASGSRTAILGPNGSGKSTLLQTIAGALAPTQGTLEHVVDGTTLAPDSVYRCVSMAAPYLGLYEDLSLEQAIDFHARFKPLLDSCTTRELARIAYLDHALHKPVIHFSSGMKQRLKLALAIMSDTPLLLLDEPTSNLDAQAIGWFTALLEKHVGQRTLVVASNRQAAEYALCTGEMDMASMK